jgi:phosphoserine aminotransferase
MNSTQLRIDYRRVHNFNAGPATLPLAVLEKAQAELLDYHGTGMSLMEMSHRSAEFEALFQQIEEDLRELVNLPRDYKALFLQGGASLQFAMLPMNLRPDGARRITRSMACGGRRRRVKPKS